MCRCGGASEHDHLNPTITFSKSLYPFIIQERVSCINVKNPQVLSVNVLREKFYVDQENDNTSLRSDSDDQILLTIPFIGTVKLKSIEFSGSKKNKSTWPTSLKVFVNAPMIDFTNVDSITPSQEFLLSIDQTKIDDIGPVRFPTRAAKFFNVNTLTLLFEKPVSGDSTEIDFIGFEGEFSQARLGAVQANYEVKPMLSDHKTSDLMSAASKTGF